MNQEEMKESARGTNASAALLLVHDSHVGTGMDFFMDRFIPFMKWRVFETQVMPDLLRGPSRNDTGLRLRREAQAVDKKARANTPAVPAPSHAAPLGAVQEERPLKGGGGSFTLRVST